jgi:hypothetical protein
MSYSLKEELKREVVNKLIVAMARGDKKVLEKVSGLGTWIKGVDKFSKLPKKDQAGAPVSAGDTATLIVKDGNHPRGLYRYDGTKWNLEIDYDAMGLESIIEGAKATQDEVNEGTIGDKFVTPVTLKSIRNGLETAIESVATTVASLSTTLDDYKTQALELFHPKGGKETLGVIGKDAEEGTQGFVTAKQMEVSYTQDEINALYDSL